MVKWSDISISYNSIEHKSFVCAEFEYQKHSISAIDRTLPGATIPGLSRPGNNGNEEVLYIPQSFNSGTSSLDFLVSYPAYSFAVTYPSAEI